VRNSALQPLYSWYLLNRSICGPENWSGGFKEEKNLLPFPGIKICCATWPIHTLVTVPTEPARSHRKHHEDDLWLRFTSICTDSKEWPQCIICHDTLLEKEENPYRYPNEIL